MSDKTITRPGVEKVSDRGTIGSRNSFEFPKNILPRKKKIVIIQIKGEIQRRIHTMTSEIQL
jgi:hypothetical protein